MRTIARTLACCIIAVAGATAGADAADGIPEVGGAYTAEDVALLRWTRTEGFDALVGATLGIDGLGPVVVVDEKIAASGIDDTGDYVWKISLKVNPMVREASKGMVADVWIRKRTDGAKDFYVRAAVPRI